jgi:hypothetical protein
MADLDVHVAADIVTSYSEDDIFAATPATPTVFPIAPEVPFPGSQAAGNDEYPAGLQTSSCGWAVMYLSDLIEENKRPTRWITRAKEKLRELADYGILGQAGPFADSRYPAGYRTTDSTRQYYGGVEVSLSPVANASGEIFGGSGFFETENGPGGAYTARRVQPLFAGDAGLWCGAFVRAYQILGDTKYLEAARRCATFLRRLQCHGKLVASYAKDSGGGRFGDGPFAQQTAPDFNESTGAYEGSLTYHGYYGTGAAFYLRDVSVVWGLKILLDADGDRVYGDNPPTDEFVERTDALLSEMISRCIEWWFSPQQDMSSATEHRTPVIPFSLATPKMYYEVQTLGAVSNRVRFINFGAGGKYPTWAEGTTEGVTGTVSLHSFEFCLALRAVYEVEGYSARVAALYTGLRSFTPNPLNAIPAEWNEDQIEKSTLGTYDPNLCLAKHLLVQDEGSNPVRMEVPNSMYDFRTAGLLAPIQAVQDPTNFRRMKDLVNTPQRRRWKVKRAHGSVDGDDLTWLRKEDGTFWEPFEHWGAVAAETDQFIPLDFPDEWPAFERVDETFDLRLFSAVGLNLQGSFPNYAGHWLVYYNSLIQACLLGEVYRLEPKAFPELQG